MAVRPVTRLLLLPGMACDARLWREQLPALEAAGPTEVATPHLDPDDAESPVGPDDPAAPDPGPGRIPQDLPSMARALLRRHPGPLALAGCSMGAMVALHAWRLAPERIRGLALLGTSARADTPEMRQLRSQAIGEFAAGRMRELLQANLLFAFHAPNASRHAEDYLAMVQSGGAEGLIRQNRAVMQREDLRPLLPAIACPTLVAGGVQDALTPPELHREMAEAIPGATLELLPECGHMLTWEQPQAVTALLLAWRQRWA